MIVWLGRWALRLASAFLVGSVAVVLIYRFVDPPVTPLMLLRTAQGALNGEWVGIDTRWIDLEAVSPAALRAVIAAEDARFFEHHGVDFAELDRARAYNERQRGTRLRGASTISMQCARSVFLWPDRTWFRKALELYFTTLLELMWGKRRILEVYVNVVEWGDGVYGIEAASERYFGLPASRLDARQAALLAAALPSPRQRNPARPTANLRRLAVTIQARAAHVNLGAL